MREKYLTFDCYGTLIDWRKGIIENFRSFSHFTNTSDYDIFGRYVSLEAEEESGYSSYSEVLSSTFLKLARELDLKPSMVDAKAFARSIVKWPAFSDTRSTLNELGLRGYRRIILSNVDRALLEETIEESGLDVDGYITAEDVRSYKPRKDHWLELLRRYDVSKDDVVHIAGSLYHDIIPASELGFKTIWVNRYGEMPGPEAKPAISVRNLSEVLDIV